MKTKTSFRFIIQFILPIFSLSGGLQAYAIKCGNEISSVQSPKHIMAPSPLPGKCGTEPIGRWEVFLHNQPQGLEDAVEKLLITLKKRPTTFSVRDLPNMPLKADSFILALKQKFEEAKKENLQNVLCWEVLNDQCEHAGVVLSLHAKPECPDYVFPTGIIRMVEFVKKDLTREIRYFVESRYAAIPKNVR